MASELKVNKISPESGTTLTLGDSGDTINFGSGVLPNFENLTVTGDLTVDTNSLKVDSTNNRVGIGTATPSVALDVVGGASFTDNVDLGDSDRLRFGASQDLQIYHDGSHSYISDQGTGNLILQASNSFKVENSGGTETYIFATENGAVELKYDNSTKIATTSTGITVTGTVAATSYTGDGSSLTGITSTTINNNADNRVITGSGTANTLEGEANLTFDGTNLDMGDSKKIRLGASQDLEIYHDGSNSYISDQGTGDLRILATDFRVKDATDSEFLITGTVNAGVSLYHDNSIKLQTTSTGVDVRTTTSGAESTLRVSSRFGSGPANVVISSGGTGDAMLRFDYEESNTDRARIGISSSSYSLMFFNNGNNERMRIDNSGYVGIGTSSPGSFNSQARNLVIGSGSGDAGMTIYSGSTSGDTGNIFFADGTSGSDPVRGGITYDHGTNQLKFRVNDSNRIEIDSSGNVGIGTSSPSDKLNIVNAGDTGVVIQNSNPGSATLSLLATGAGRVRSSGVIIFDTGGSTERMRIDSSGVVNIGTTSAVGGATALSADGISGFQNQGNYAININRQTNDGSVANFQRGGNNRGSISVDGTGTTYNTTSDYRLKDNIENITDGTERLMKLKPVRHSWKESSVTVDGFLAHEVQEAGLEYAVTGEKDGKEMQSMDYGRITPILVSALQNAINEINILKQQIQKLEIK
jgi:hypothetical protein